MFSTGPPVSEDSKSQKSFTLCRDKLIEILASDNDLLVSLASVFCSESIIDKKTKTEIRSLKGKKGSILLLDNLGRTIRKRPEVLPKVLDKMDDEDALQAIVKKIRGTVEEKEDQVQTGL